MQSTVNYSKVLLVFWYAKVKKKTIQMKTTLSFLHIFKIWYYYWNWVSCYEKLTAVTQWTKEWCQKFTFEIIIYGVE